MQPTRRSYSKSFKAQVIQECAQPGASIASVALSHSLNANLVHKWIRLQTQKSTAPQPAFIPLPAYRDRLTPTLPAWCYGDGFLATNSRYLYETQSDNR
ncbi:MULTISPECIES: transposase [Pseudomonas]|uniref:IS66-like element accessory protein TnpA n=1 Tax=Pseudomonas TaxID=286 RepID=UPI001C49C208|nr:MULTISPECIES: transposase [Pseudomonas]